MSKRDELVKARVEAWIAWVEAMRRIWDEADQALSEHDKAKEAGR